MSCCAKRRHNLEHVRPPASSPGGVGPSADEPIRSLRDPRRLAALLAYLARNAGARKH